MVVCLWAFCLYDIYHIISYLYLHCKLCFTPEWILKGNIHPHSWQTHVLCLTAQEPMSSVSLIVVSARSLGRRMAKCCCYTLRKRWRCRNMISTICWGVVVVCQMSWIMGLDGWFFWWAVSIYTYLYLCVYTYCSRGFIVSSPTIVVMMLMFIAWCKKQWKFSLNDVLSVPVDFLPPHLQVFSYIFQLTWVGFRRPLTNQSLVLAMKALIPANLSMLLLPWIPWSKGINHLCL